MTVPAPSIAGKRTLLRLMGPGRALPASSAMQGEKSGDHRWEGWAHTGIRSLGANGLMVKRKAQWEGQLETWVLIGLTDTDLSKRGLRRGLHGKEDKCKM